MNPTPTLLSLGGVLLAACSASQSAPEAANSARTPSAHYPRGFDASASDPRALAVAERVTERLGGRDVWDETLLLHWNFLGRRSWLWDRAESRARVENSDGTVVAIDLERRTGRAWLSGAPLQGAELQQALQAAHEQFVNDSYWLVMPYKLFDPGVRLAYAGPRSASDGQDCEVISLTFDGVGYTPRNRYDVYVDSRTDLVVQWDFYADSEDEDPAGSWPWTGWQSYGGLWLAGGHGQLQLTEIARFDSLPNVLFSSPMPFELAAHPSPFEPDPVAPDPFALDPFNPGQP